jgi:hypothetical protein
LQPTHKCALVNQERKRHMSKKSFKRNLALFSGSALALYGLTAAPAYAVFGADEIALTPTTGDNFAVFSLDELDVTLRMSALIPDSASGTDLTSLHFTSEDEPLLEIHFADAAIANDGATVKMSGRDENGDAVTINGGNVITVVDDDGDGVDLLENDATNGKVLIDFAGLGITELFVHDIDGGLLDNEVNFTFRLLDNPAGDDTDFTYTNAEVAALADLSAYGDGGADITMQAFLETDGDADTVDANAGDAVTLQFVDQEDVSAVVKVERFASGADQFDLVNGAAAIPAVITFSKIMNLDQINLGYWEFDIDSSVNADDVDDATATKETLDGLPDQDANGKLTITVPAANPLNDGETVAVNIQAQDAAGAQVATSRIFRSSAATVLEAADDTTDGTEYSVTGDVSDDEAGAVTAREGAAAITYTLALEDGGEAQGANRPVYAVVTYTDSAKTLDALVVSGHTRPLLQSGVAIVNGFTNSDGEWSITVTSSNPEDGSDYTVEFFYIDVDGDDNAASTATITTTYDEGDYDAVTSDSSVYNGASIAMSFEVADQFEDLIDETADGDAIKLRVEATNTDDLEEYLTVSGGAASLSFTNYLAAGESDVVTVTAYTGDDDDPTDLGGALSLTIYNSEAASVVTVTDDDQTADVVYADFSVGDDSEVTAGSATTFAGTALDSNGQGVPGALVTIAGEEIQFLNAAGDYTIGTATTVADEAGAWSVDAWTHLADDTELTVTAGTGSVTATFTGELDDAGTLSAANLLFTWNLPSAVAVNTTYRVDATVTDVWGNPVANADVEFAGEAAAQFNSDATVTKATNARGVATAYLRSLEDVTGLAAVSATLANDIDFDADGNDDVTDVGSVFTDDEDTSWDESAASDELTAEINFLSSMPAPAADQKLNSGSFNGYVAVYAKGYKGATLSWKIAGVWFKTTITEDYVVFQRPTLAVGVNVNVELYINGQRPAAFTKTVLTR